LSLLGLSIGLLVSFVVIEARASAPLMPLNFFKLRSVVTSNIVGALWAAAMFAWFFLSAVYMQLVLDYNPLQVGLAFLPANLIMAAFSLGVSAKIVMRFGLRMPVVVGMLLVAIGLALFARAPIDGNFMIDVFPSMMLLGLGAGMALNPVLLAAMNDVPQDEAGLASGIVNTSFMMGGALGLAILASVAALRSHMLLAAGQKQAYSLIGGYHLAFVIGAIFALIAAMVAWKYLPNESAKTQVSAQSIG
jgi:predicted MFS family arabinose efflux permease